MTTSYDLIVIGSGAGLGVAGAMAGRGWSVALVEGGPMGGTCLNRGCIPSKMLIHSADVVESIRRADLFGVHVDGYTVDFPSIVKRVTEHVDHESAQIRAYYDTSENPKFYATSARFVGPKTLQVGDATIRGDRILISSGGRPWIPEVPGLTEAGYVTSDEALRLTSLPRALTILGGGYIAAELAHFFGSLGTKVAIVQRRDVLVPNEDEEVSATFTEIFRARYAVHTGHEAERVAKRGSQYEVTIRSKKGGATTLLRSDQLLVAAGRVPNTDLLAVDKTGVRTDAKGFVVTDEYLETNVPGIFSLGDAVGHYLFRHSANLEAQFAYDNLRGGAGKVPVDYSAMPHAIFTSPQIAGVGKTEQELRAAGVDYTVGRHAYFDTAMGKAIEDRDGFVKILVDRTTRRILGCHILGHDASTLIHEVVVAMKAGDGTVDALLRAVHIHPALSEVVQRAAWAAG
jgi:dihydrolipoamide dehydrogenase